MALFVIERIGNSKQKLEESVREALTKFAAANPSNANFGRLAGAIEQTIESFPYSFNGINLAVTVQGTTDANGFDSVSISLRVLSSEVML